MFCPVCNVEMLILELNDVEIDYCHQCAGIWLDEGELELLISSPSPSGNGNSAILAALSNPSSGAKGKRRCPVCRKRMSRVNVPVEPGVEIDKCPRNHGLWFDKGELEQITASTRGEPAVNFLNSLFHEETTARSSKT